MRNLKPELHAPSFSYERWMRLLIGLFIAYTVYQTLGFFSIDTRLIDFEAYLAAAQALSQGAPIYPEGNWPLLHENPLGDVEIGANATPKDNLFYVYPPLLALALQPWLALPLAWAKWLWTGTMLFAYAGAVGLLLWEGMRNGWLNRVEALTFGVVSFYWAPLTISLVVGQVTPLLFFLIALHAGLALYQRDAAAGVVLALAVLVKVSPAVLLPFWLLLGRWRLLMGFMAGLTAGVLLTGWQTNATFAASILPQLTRGEHSELNHSLFGVIANVLYGPAPMGWISPEAIEQAGSGLLILRGAAWAAWALTFVAAWRWARNGNTLMGVSLLLLAAMVWSPVARLHDFVWMIALVIITYAWVRDHFAAWRMALWLYWFAMLNGNFIAWHAQWAFDPFSEALLSYPPTLANTLLWLGLIGDGFFYRKSPSQPIIARLKA